MSDKDKDDNSTGTAAAAACRSSTYIFSSLAIAVAVAIYFLVTKFVFPLIVDHHDGHGTTATATLTLVIGLCCAVSTLIPGIFTLSCIAAGFALGWWGIPVAVISVFVGLCISFELGRTLFRDRASLIVSQKFPTAKELSQLHPVKAVWISWFLPVPLAVKIFFWASCSNVSLGRFILSALVVAVPHISTLVIIGAQASALTNEKGGVHQKVFFVLGLLSVGVASFALSKWAQKSVAAAADSVA